MTQFEFMAALAEIRLELAELTRRIKTIEENHR